MSAVKLFCLTMYQSRILTVNMMASGFDEHQQGRHEGTGGSAVCRGCLYHVWQRTQNLGAKPDQNHQRHARMYFFTSDMNDSAWKGLKKKNRLFPCKGSSVNVNVDRSLLHTESWKPARCHLGFRIHGGQVYELETWLHVAREDKCNIQSWRGADHHSHQDHRYEYSQARKRSTVSNWFSQAARHSVVVKLLPVV